MTSKECVVLPMSCLTICTNEYSLCIHCMYLTLVERPAGSHNATVIWFLICPASYQRPLIYTILYLGVISVHILSLFFVKRNVNTLQEFHTITFNFTQSYSSNILFGIAITTMPLTTQNNPHLYWRAGDCCLLIAISDRGK